MHTCVCSYSYDFLKGVSLDQRIPSWSSHTDHCGVLALMNLLGKCAHFSRYDWLVTIELEVIKQQLDGYTLLSVRCDYELLFPKVRKCRDHLNCDRKRPWQGTAVAFRCILKRSSATQWNKDLPTYQSLYNNWYRIALPKYFYPSESTRTNPQKHDQSSSSRPWPKTAVTFQNIPK